jgi:cold shock CspA family protein
VTQRLTGTVVEFDEHVGLGVVEAAEQRYPFHCTQIADGTRTIAVGTAVSFDVVDRLKGPEAYRITPE